MNATKIPVGQIKTFRITGVDRNGKRFVKETNSYDYACMFNLWRGSVWVVFENGKRKLMKRVLN